MCLGKHNPKEEAVELDFGFLEAEGINVKEGIGYTGSKEKYASALQRYLKGYETNRKSVEELLSSGDTEGYMIKVHALKSNSRMIGAAGMASAFEELELAAKDGNTGFIAEKTGEALMKYDELINIIKPIGDIGEVHTADEISGAEAKETAERLLEALDEFDDELSSELISKLKGYPFRITQKGKLKEAAKYVSDFMYDEASELIKEIYPSIE